jgi:sorbitol-specific phosphotransferase system component IIC
MTGVVVLASVIQVQGEAREDELLEITTKKPSEKIPATPILSLSFICRRETMVMGRRMMMTSVQMLTESR